MSAPTPPWEAEALKALAEPSTSPADAAVLPRKSFSGLALLIVAVIPVPYVVWAIAHSIRTHIEGHDQLPSELWQSIPAVLLAQLAAPIAIGLGIAGLVSGRMKVLAKAGIALGGTSFAAAIAVPWIFSIFWDATH